jgi:hypothetical protein
MRARIGQRIDIDGVVRELREREHKYGSLVTFHMRDHNLSWREAKTSVKNSIKWALIKKEWRELPH